MNVTVSSGGRYVCSATVSASSPSLQATQQLEFCSKSDSLLAEFPCMACILHIIHMLSCMYAAAEPVITGVNFTPDPHIGESFFLECAFVGIPPPTVVWSKDGSELTEMDDKTKIVLTDRSSRLEITEATSTDFNGMYECDVSNVAGVTSKSFHIELQGLLVSYLLISTIICFILHAYTCTHQ